MCSVGMGSSQENSLSFIHSLGFSHLNYLLGYFLCCVIAAEHLLPSPERDSSPYRSLGLLAPQMGSQGCVSHTWERN